MNNNIFDTILIWILDVFLPTGKEKGRLNKNEEMTAFFFGASPFGSESEHESEPINEDYDQGPDW